MIVLTVFWQQQLRFMAPTPVPSGHRQVPLGMKVSHRLPALGADGRLRLLHFFNPDCPCSRFNLQHFKSLSRRYAGEVAFFVVQQSDEQEAEAAAAFGELDIKVIEDADGALADICGVYATPQAVILDEAGRIIYRGNYNRARYCSSRNSWFAQQMLDARLGKAPGLLPDTSAFIPYGCNLPSDKDKLSGDSASYFAVLDRIF